MAWLGEEEAEYLVTFPSWYPEMTGYPDREPDAPLHEVFSTDAAVTIEQGQDNMVIYRLDWE